MIDFLKMQTEYIKAYYNKEMRIGSDNTGFCHFQQNTQRENAYIMISGFWMCRIPWIYAMIRTHEDDNVPKLDQLFADFENDEHRHCYPVYDIATAKTTTGTKKVRVFQDQNGRKYGFNADVLDKYVKADDTVTYDLTSKSNALMIFQFDTCDMVMLPIKPPKERGEW